MTLILCRIGERLKYYLNVTPLGLILTVGYEIGQSQEGFSMRYEMDQLQVILTVKKSFLVTPLTVGIK